MTAPHLAQELADRYLPTMRRAAEEASKVLLSGYRSKPKADKKGSIDFVTEFDRESERVLRRVLGETDLHLVAEEEGGVAGSRTLYVDPLDGTTNFLHGHPFYAVSIGLVVDGVPLVGLVHAPSLGVVWAGAAGAFATRNGEPCHVTDTADLDSALLATGFPYDRRTSAENNFDAFMALKLKSRGVRRCGSASMDLCLVADGTYDGYWERKLKPWDLAGGAAIVAGAGGRLSNFQGGPPDVLSGYLVATNGALHDRLVEAIP